jgi:hypothetical protein
MKQGTPRQSYLRLVILDYPKKLMQDSKATRVFSDLLRFRQMNFERSTETHVYVDKLDLIGTHYLVYDLKDFFEPRIVAGIRTSYMDRCQLHNLKIPLDDMILGAKLPTQEAYRIFKSKNGPLVECNGWFINPEYSSSRNGGSLPDILFYALTCYLLRQGIHHFIGATNERFKASRHVARVGSFEDGHILLNPSFPGEHKLTLVDHFNPEWQRECYEKYLDLMHERIEFHPGDLRIKSFEEIEHLVGATKKVA